MKRFLTLSAVFVLTAAIAVAQAPEKAKPAAAKPAVKAAPPEKTPEEKTKEMQEAWAGYMTPGPMQEMLAKSSGEWTEEVTSWMVPGAPPEVNKASCINTMILGGRYQQSVHKGEFGGMPFEGIGTLGYDNAIKKFVSTWVDNMGTGIMYTEGVYDPKGNIINFTGKAVDPVSGKNMPVREIYKIINENTHTMEMYMTENGKEFKTMEIKLTRN